MGREENWESRRWRKEGERNGKKRGKEIGRGRGRGIGGGRGRESRRKGSEESWERTRIVHRELEKALSNILCQNYLERKEVA